jgi:hypothetical protein
LRTDKEHLSRLSMTEKAGVGGDGEDMFEFTPSNLGDEVLKEQLSVSAGAATALKQENATTLVLTL